MPLKIKKAIESYIIEREILLFLHELGLSVRKNATYTYMEIHVLIIK